MPLVIMAGRPCTGKTLHAQALAAFLREQGHDVYVVNEESEGVDKVEGYKTATAEKITRATLKAAATRHLTRKTFLVLDSINYFKSYRYEMFRHAVEQGTQHCVVWVDAPKEKARAWNAAREGGFTDELFDDLWGRFEEPNERRRWDHPCFRPDGYAKARLVEGDEYTGDYGHEPRPAAMAGRRDGAGVTRPSAFTRATSAPAPAPAAAPVAAPAASPTSATASAGGGVEVGVGGGAGEGAAEGKGEGEGDVGGPTAAAPAEAAGAGGGAGAGAGSVGAGGDSGHGAGTPAAASGEAGVATHDTACSVADDAAAVDPRARFYGGTVPQGGPLPFDDILSAVTVKARDRPVNHSTIKTPLSDPNLLHQLDSVTQEIVGAIVAALPAAYDGCAVMVPGCRSKVVLARKPNKSELRRLRRQFLKLTKQHPPEDTAHVRSGFVQYLNSSLAE